MSNRWNNAESANKELQDVMELAKKKMEKERLIQERKNRRIVKIQEYYFCKAYLVIQIGRAISIARRNFGWLRQLIIWQLMSYLYSVKKVKLGTNEKLRNIKSLMMTFNKAMLRKLDHQKEWELRMDYQISRCLTTEQEDEKLDRIEYLQLFSALLQHHGYRTRFLVAFETKSLEDLGFIQVSRTNRMKKMEDSHNSFLKQKIMNKRKRTKFDILKDTDTKDICPTLTKLAKTEELIEETKEVESILSHQKESSIKAINFLDKFAFKSSLKKGDKPEFARSEASSIQTHFGKSKRTPEKKAKKKFCESNLIVTSLEDVEMQDQKQECKNPMNSDTKKPDFAKPEVIKEFLKSDDEDNQKLDYQKGSKFDLLKDLWFLEVLNTSTNKWIIVDVFNETIHHSKLMMSSLIEQKNILFLFAIGAYTFRKASAKECHKLYMKDVTLKYSSYFHQMLAAKNSLYIQDKIIQEIDMIAPFFSNIWTDPVLKLSLESEDREVYNLERYYIPEKYNGFRSHKHFVLESLLSRYQFIRPGVQPYNNLKHKGEFIYLRKDVVLLRTKEQWRKLKREVKEGQKYIKKVKGNYNDKDRMALLFGYWQTKHFQNKLNEDGSLPENEHGNLEIFTPSDVPEGATHLKIKRARFICKKLEIDFKEALTGFETGANGMSYPVIEGVIVLNKDVDLVLKTHEKMEKEREMRAEKRRKHEAKSTWNTLIRKVCIRHYTSKLFEMEDEERAQNLPMDFKG
jgi:hypothetical protein